MNKNRVIRPTKKTNIVTLKVLVEGEALSQKYQVTKILVETEVNKINTATIVFSDSKKFQQGFALSNDELLVPGRHIEISVGYGSNEETIFKGIVVKHSLKISNGSAQLNVECKDEAVKLTVGRKNNYFYDLSDSAIFESIIDTYGLDKELDTTNFTHQEMVQYHTSDWDFILARAQANGQLCFLEDGKITIKKPNLHQDAIETFAYGDTILDFESEMDARNQFSKVTSHSWSPTDQELLNIEAIDPGIELSGNLSPSELAETIGLDNLQLRHGGTISNEELQGWADAKLFFQQLAKIRGSVKFQGISSVKPGVMVKLEGVGERFNGNVYITAVRHEIANGNWMTDAQFGISPKWFSETHEINPLPASGLLAAVNGLQIGIVSRLQEDPDGEYRIMVQIPIINDQEQGIWCRIASLDAGENRGFFFRPEIGDEVIIGFINDDPNDAVVLGMLHSSAKPAPLTASDQNNEKGFVTRSEIKVLFDDDKKSIRIETPVGKVISLDEDAGSILISDDHTNVITIDGNGITVENDRDINIKAKGDVNLEGTNVNIKANAQFKAEGSAGAEMVSSGIATVKGSLVRIN